jgi:hypothetical protein
MPSLTCLRCVRQVDATSTLPPNPGVDNLIGPDGCRALAAACHAHRSLKTVSVQILGLDEGAIMALLDALTHNTSLEHLHVVVVADEWMYLSDRTIDLMCALLESNVTLRELNLVLPRLLTNRMHLLLHSLRINGGLLTFSLRFGDVVFDHRTAALPRLDRRVFRECLELSNSTHVDEPQETSKYVVAPSHLSSRADWSVIGQGHFGVVHSCQLNGRKTCVKSFRARPDQDMSRLIRGQINEVR